MCLLVEQAGIEPASNTTFTLESMSFIYQSFLALYLNTTILFTVANTLNSFLHLFFTVFTGSRCTQTQALAHSEVREAMLTLHQNQLHGLSYGAYLLQALP
jgi:hypothetical protein